MNGFPVKRKSEYVLNVKVLIGIDQERNEVNLGKKIINLEDQRFERLTVIKDSGKRYRGEEVIWLCQCDCGNLTEVRGYYLRSGHTKSCGCLHREISARIIKKVSFKHGGKGTRLYNLWDGIKQRCKNPNATKYETYGKRGIKICPEWETDFNIFKNWALKNGYKPGLTIDRLDYDGNYEPSNCQWLTRSENVKKYWREECQR